MSKKVWLIIPLVCVLLGLSGCGSDEAPVHDIAPPPADVSAASNAPTPPGAETSDNAASQTSEGETPLPVASQASLKFNISGGPLEFCDELHINPQGEFSLDRACHQDQIAGILNQADYVSLQSWFDNLASFRLTFEDAPENGHDLITDLVFYGRGDVIADDRQQQIIYDWVSGLTARVRPQEIAAPPSIEAAAEAVDSLCAHILRPTLLTIDVENPTTLFVLNRDPDNGEPCHIPLSRLPSGRIAAAGGAIYYPAFDPTSETVSVLQLDASGRPVPLAFTGVSAKEPGPFDFVVSSDARKIAWSQTTIDFDSEPPLYVNSLWMANVDGSEKRVILDQAANDEVRFVTPIRFSADGRSFYYALQPDIGGPAHSGRFDNLYRVESGGPPRLIYACSAEENPLCVTGLALDGQVITVLDPSQDALQIIDQHGGIINMVPLPATDYVERVAFSEGGHMAFFAAKLSQASEEEPALPDPGYITILAPPYTGEPQIVLADNRAGTLWGWLGEDSLAFGQIDQTGRTNTALVSLNDSQVVELSPYIAVGVLQ